MTDTIKKHGDAPERPENEGYPHFFSPEKHLHHDWWEFHAPNGVYVVHRCGNKYPVGFYAAEQWPPSGTHGGQYLSSGKTPWEAADIMEAHKTTQRN